MEKDVAQALLELAVDLYNVTAGDQGTTFKLKHLAL